MVDKPTHTSSRVNSYLDEHREISRLVREASKFSLQLPVIGKVRVPPPKQLAAYGVLGALAAAGIVEWPVAVSLALGVAVVGRATRSAEPEPEAAPAGPAPRIVDGEVTAPRHGAAASGATARRAARTPSSGSAARRIAGPRPSRDS